jgi:hypothetical protein
MEERVHLVSEMTVFTLTSEIFRSLEGGEEGHTKRAPIVLDEMVEVEEVLERTLIPEMVVWEQLVKGEMEGQIAVNVAVEVVEGQVKMGLMQHQSQMGGEVMD